MIHDDVNEIYSWYEGLCLMDRNPGVILRMGSYAHAHMEGDLSMHETY